MRGIAGEDHAVVHEALEPAALERVDARPLELERDVLAEHAAHARCRTLLRVELGLAIDVPAELEIEPPDVVRLLVQQRRLSARKRRIEPEPAFGGPLRLHADVGDQEMILEHLAYELETEQSRGPVLRLPSAAIR